MDGVVLELPNECFTFSRTPTYQMTKKYKGPNVDFRCKKGIAQFVLVLEDILWGEREKPCHQDYKCPGVADDIGLHVFCRLKRCLLEEGTSEIAVQDYQQIMLIEFSEIQEQGRVLCEDRLSLIETLCQLEILTRFLTLTIGLHLTMIGMLRRLCEKTLALIHGDLHKVNVSYLHDNP
ncbi:unnamed protein product [Lactuca virosa]|uniref:Uncharacterized protein n=1 Tax=Lactuca virosa TaxID=75947 RepID=A0AAU9MZS6_9ASTR|nr:unnamed protein product [Lactuca virosa]